MSRETHARLLAELAKYESGLREWMSRCTVNAIWYLADPIGALREADLGIDEELLRKLEPVLGREARAARSEALARTAA